MAQASGPIGGYSATITTHPGRLELKLSAGVPPPVGPVGSHSHQENPPVIADVLPALAALVSYAEQLFPGCNPARLGLILNLSCVEASAEAAVASFRKNLPIMGELPHHATDLNFALNLPTTVALSESSSSVVNRFCRWGVSRRQVISIEMNVGSGIPVPIFKTKESIASTLQIDINSTPEAVPEMIATWNPELAYKMLKRMEDIAKPIFKGGFNHLVEP